MRSLGLLRRLLMAVLKDFRIREIQPCNKYEKLPPIRYIGGPTEIYLA